MTVQIARVEERFKSPGPQPNGLHAAADGLWYIDQGDLKVYKLDYQTGETLFEAQTDTEHSSGITFGNGSMWISSTFQLTIAELDPATGRTKAQHPVTRQWHRRLGRRPRKRSRHRRAWSRMERRQGLRRRAALAIGARHGRKNLDPGTRLPRTRPARTRPGLGRRRHPVGRLTPPPAPSAASIREDGRVWEVIRVEAPVEVHGLTIHEGILWYCDAATRAIGQLYLD